MEVKRKQVGFMVDDETLNNITSLRLKLNPGKIMSVSEVIREVINKSAVKTNKKRTIKKN